MPKALEQKLIRTAEKRGYGEDRTGAYVYGTLAKFKKAREDYKKKKA